MAQWDWFALWERRLRSARMARDDVQRRLAAVGEGALALSLPEETAAGNGEARPAAVASRASGAALRFAGGAALLSAGADRAAGPYASPVADRAFGLRAPVPAPAAEVQTTGTPAARAANLAAGAAQAAAPAARRAIVFSGTAASSAAAGAGGAVSAVVPAAAGVLSGPPDWLAEAEASPLTGLVALKRQKSVFRVFSEIGGTAAPLAAAVLRRAGTEAAVSAVLSAAAQPAALQQAARPELPARADSGAFVQRETGAGRMASFSGNVWPGGVFDSAQAGAAASAAWQTAAAQRIAALFPVPEPSGEESLRRVPRPAESAPSQAERIVMSAGRKTVQGEEHRETGDFWELWTRRFAEGLYSSPEGVHG